MKSLLTALHVLRNIPTLPKHRPKIQINEEQIIGHADCLFITVIHSDANRHLKLDYCQILTTDHLIV